MSEDGWAPITEFAAGWHADPDDPPMVRKSGDTVEMKGKIVRDDLELGAS